jgi:hypothetical protein
VSSATNFASLIGKATANDIFYYKEYNEQVTETSLKKYGESYFYDKFVPKLRMSALICNTSWFFWFRLARLRRVN